MFDDGKSGAVIQADTAERGARVRLRSASPARDRSTCEVAR
jgi:hypothetical protein